MKNALFNCGAGMLLALTLVLGGCSKPVPTVTVEAKPSPTPAPDDLFDAKDLDTDKLRAKASKAADSLGKYLETQDPKLRAKFQKLSHRITDQLTKDKGRWREKLEAKRRDLGPQIERLKEQLARDGGAARDQLPGATRRPAKAKQHRRRKALQAGNHRRGHLEEVQGAVEGGGSAKKGRADRRAGHEFKPGGGVGRRRFPRGNKRRAEGGRGKQAEPPQPWHGIFLHSRFRNG